MAAKLAINPPTPRNRLPPGAGRGRGWSAMPSCANSFSAVCDVAGRPSRSPAGSSARRAGPRSATSRSPASFPPRSADPTMAHGVTICPGPSTSGAGEPRPAAPPPASSKAAFPLPCAPTASSNGAPLVIGKLISCTSPSPARPSWWRMSASPAFSCWQSNLAKPLNQQPINSSPGSKPSTDACARPTSTPLTTTSFARSLSPTTTLPESASASSLQPKLFYPKCCTSNVNPHPRCARDDGVDGPHPASVCHTGSGQTATSERGPSMEKASMIGLDIAKNVFELHGRSAAGEVVLRRSLKRSQVEKFFAKLPKAVIGLEACGSAHHWARLLGKLGHEVRLMPPAYVKPYVKRNKSDAIDAAACWEAVGRPDMRFVPVKTVDQQAALSLHRSRDLLVSQRTQLGNALRALLSEFGIVAGHGNAGLAQLVDELRAGRLELPADAEVAAMALADQRAALDAAADALERRIVAQAKADKKARMLWTAPGVGPLSAHAALATLPDPSRFRCGRDFAAWLGLAPRLHGTGGKTRTGSITKQGNAPLRRLLV